jgi:hypothetical protein
VALTVGSAMLVLALVLVLALIVRPRSGAPDRAPSGDRIRPLAVSGTPVPSVEQPERSPSTR